MDILLSIFAASPSVADAIGQSGPQIEWVSLIKLVVTVVSVTAGMFFVLAGTIGVIRLPDFYTRLHAAGMTDTLGAEMILFGLIVQSGVSQMTLKLLLVAFFLFVTSPAATHAVANAAYKNGLKPLLGKYRAPLLDEES